MSSSSVFQIVGLATRVSLSSTELEELIEVSHRILVMKHGQIVDEVQAEEVSIDRLYAMCMEG
jgi:ABC-type sugar transport system ATPase subunit